MSERLHHETTRETLLQVLKKLMSINELAPFRLVGGTALSLQLGHRESIDIDLFSDSDVKNIDFKAIDTTLKNHFSYVEGGSVDDFNIGLMRFIGNSKEEAVKVDVFCTDAFVKEAIVKNGIRMAHIKDISAMKLEIISTGGRKKDFWDLSELLEYYSLEQLLNFYSERYPYSDPAIVIKGMTNFSEAEEMEDPVCLKGKIWELIKLDIEDSVDRYKN